MFGEKNYTDRERREGERERGRRGEIKRGERVMKLPIGGYYPRDIRCYKLWDGDPPIPQHDAAAESDWSREGNAVHSVKTLVHDGEQRYQEREGEGRGREREKEKGREREREGEREREREGERVRERERGGAGGGGVMPL